MSSYDSWKLATPPEYRDADDAPDVGEHRCDSCESLHGLILCELRDGGKVLLCGLCAERERKPAPRPSLFDEAVALARLAVPK